jgi:hypothetical protein
MSTESPPVGPDTKVEQHPDIASRTIDGQEVVVVPRTRKLQILNEVATRIWELCDGRPVSRIAETIVDEYEVEREEAQRDVIELVSDMLARGMVRVTDGG